MIDDDIEFAGIDCPKCGAEMMRRPCRECEDGFVDLYDEDPLWYDEGDTEKCSECHGRGHHIWCRKCAWDYLEKRYLNGRCELETTIATASQAK